MYKEVGDTEHFGKMITANFSLDDPRVDESASERVGYV